MSLAEDAFGGQGMQNRAIQDQLIGFLTDRLSQDFMKMKVMRDNPCNFQATVDVSLTGQNLRKSFNLRSGKRESNWGILLVTNRWMWTIYVQYNVALNAIRKAT